MSGKYGARVCVETLLGHPLNTSSCILENIISNRKVRVWGWVGRATMQLQVPPVVWLPYSGGCVMPTQQAVPATSLLPPSLSHTCLSYALNPKSLSVRSCVPTTPVVWLPHSGGCVRPNQQAVSATSLLPLSPHPPCRPHTFPWP